MHIPTTTATTATTTTPASEMRPGAHLARVHAEGRLIRGWWDSGDPRGRELMCLHTALAGDPCPRWLARLLPWLSSAGTEAAWPGHIQRVVALAPRLGEIRGERSERLRARCLAVILREAAEAATEAEAAGCEAAAARAALAVEAAEEQGEEAVLATASWATWAASAAAWTAAETAAAAAGATRVPWGAGAEAAAAAGAEAADRIISAILDAIEEELEVSA